MNFGKHGYCCIRFTVMLSWFLWLILVPWARCTQLLFGLLHTRSLQLLGCFRSHVWLVYQFSIRKILWTGEWKRKNQEMVRGGGRVSRAKKWVGQICSFLGMGKNVKLGQVDPEYFLSENMISYKECQKWLSYHIDGYLFFLTKLFWRFYVLKIHCELSGFVPFKPFHSFVFCCPAPRIIHYYLVGESASLLVWICRRIGTGNVD